MVVLRSRLPLNFDQNKKFQTFVSHQKFSTLKLLFLNTSRTDGTQKLLDFSFTIFQNRNTRKFVK